MRNKKGQFIKGVYVGFGFKKGHSRKHTEEEKQKISKALKGRKGSVAWNKGKLGWIKHSKETRDKIRLASLGRKLSASAKKKLSELHRGAKNHSWKGGVTPLRVKIWHSPEYKLWRTSVFVRDGYTCVWCGQRGGRIEADHIKPFALFPELRFAIDNGRTLCKACHIKTETYGKWK